MNINTTIEDDKVILSLSGRLDANTALRLKRILNNSVDKGQANILIDCEKLDEISSAGIDFLLSNYKKFQAFNGSLTLSNASYGIIKIFENLNVPSIISENKEKEVLIDNKPDKFTKIENTTYQFFDLGNNGKFSLEAFGNPNNFATHNFSNKSPFLLKYDENSIGLGLGALSYNLANSFDTFGEFINIGNYTFHIPSVLNALPDYQKTNNDIIENDSCKVNTLYGLRVPDSNFEKFLSFTTEDSPCQLTSLMKACMSFINSKAFYFVTFAQLNSFSGVKLIKSPLLDKHEDAFDEKNILENFKYLSGEKYKNHIAVLVGFVVNDADLMVQKFVKPYDSDLGLYAHIHSLIFNYQSLDISQDSKINDIMSSLTKNSRALDLSHLVKDKTNNYETSFSKGFCFFNSLSEFKMGGC